MNKQISFNQLFFAFSREVELLWKFTKTDLLVSVVSASIFMLVALFSAASVNLQSLAYFGLGLCYFIFYIYPFDISNQLEAIEEDKLNKPFRPLPSGLINEQGAYFRYYLGTAVYLILGAFLGVFYWSVLWVIVTYMLNLRGWDKNWITKNFVSMGLGTAAQLGAAWQIIGPFSSSAIIWISLISFWVALTSCTQDFRDVEGDRKTGRKTLPILVGDQNARIITMSFWAIMSLSVGIVYFQLQEGLFWLDLALILPALATHLYIMYRLWFLRSPKADGKTYLIQCLLYCYLLLLSVYIFL